MINIERLEKGRGIGSSFSYLDSNFLADNDKADINLGETKYFYTGRHALKFVFNTLLLKNDQASIWIPEYYCQHVTHWLKENYNNLKFYPNTPSDVNKIIHIGDLKDNDVVLINNFLGGGISPVDKKEKEIAIVEDHSHAWLNPSCIQSKADYCIASLRKSLPIPLGGIVWKPNGILESNVDIKKDNTVYKDIWNQIGRAMKMKTEYEQSKGANESLKPQFLKNIGKQENSLHSDYDLVVLDHEHEKIIKEYVVKNILEIKRQNSLALDINKLSDRNNGLTIMKGKEQLFGLIVHSYELKKIEEFKNYLIGYDIYPSLLWPGNNPKYGYYLNIHIDYRYSKKEMDYISDVVNAFTLS